MRISSVLALSVALALAVPAFGQDDGPSEAEKALLARIDGTAGKEKALAEAELGRLLEGEGRWSEAASAWRQARKLRGDLTDFEGEARAVLGFAEEVLGSGETGGTVAAAFEDARVALRRARDAGVKPASVALGLARCAEVAGETDVRVAELRTAYESMGDDVRIGRALAGALAAAGRAGEALALSDKISEAHPADAELALALYDAAPATDDATRRRAAARAVAAAPEDGRGWNAMWRLFAPKQRWSEMADAFLELAKANPASAWAARYAGIACSNARRFDEALDWLEKAWARNGKDAFSRSEAAKILYYQKSDRPGAMKRYSEALAADPKSLDAYAGLYNMATRYDAEGDKAAAATVFELLAKVRAGDPLAQNNYANSLRFAGRYDDSERTYLAAIAAFPADAQLRNDYALLLDVEGRGADACVVLKAAHEVDPKNNDSMENLGFLARAAGDREEALKWFRMAHASLVTRGESDHKHRINVDDQRWPLPALR